MSITTAFSTAGLNALNSAVAGADSITSIAINSNFPGAPPQSTDTTWYRTPQIAWQNWNQFFPLQLMVVDNINGSYSQKTGGNWSWIAPVGLESLSISMPFAATNSVTLGGDVTEYNGAPVRMISISGTMGVLPGRQPGPPAPAISFLNSIFAGTLTNLNNTISAVQSIANLGNPPNFVTNVIPTETFTDPSLNGLISGYAHLRLLQVFFESFNELKKTKAGRNSRLAFAIWKQEAVYLCTPIDFTLSQSAASPLEYSFSIQLKATKRVKLSNGSAGAVTPYVPIQLSPGLMAQLMNTIQAVRTTLQSAQKTILAFGGDIEASLFTPLRELTLVAKDALSLPFAVADMANNVIDSMKSAILDLATTQNAITNLKGNIQRAYGTVTQNADTISFNLAELANQQNGSPTAVEGILASPANNPFLDPSANFDFFSGISVGDLNLPPKVLSTVAAERQRIRSLTRLDYEIRRDAIQKLIDDYSNSVGLGDPTYNLVYGITPPVNTVSAIPTDDDYNVLFALNSLLTSINALVVSTTTNTHAKQDTIATIAGMATRSGIAFQVPVSKYAIPFPYGATLEGLAAKYLGNPDRYIELIALNGLTSPYVDEEGFELPLLSNGVLNTLFVSDSSNLFVGQPVWVSSTTTIRLATRITGIKVLNNSQSLITVKDDVSLYTTVARATLLAYLPNTINSQQTIYIPSQAEPQANALTLRNIPGINQFDPLLAVGGVDFLLSPTNDIVITNSGDNKWATGITGLTQWVRTAFKTVSGSLLRHPEYGLNLQPGQSLADLSATQIVQSIQATIADNPAFNGVPATKVSINGTVADLDIALSINGTENQILPISMQVMR